MTNLNRRKFLLVTAATAGAVGVYKPILIARDVIGDGDAAKVVDLNGQWQVSQAGKEDWIPATVPGCVHTDLLAAGKISDPFYRDNEKTVQWIGETGWVFRRSFTVPASILKKDRIQLRCEGLDTLATIRMNGREIGRADNMFRTWEFDVTGMLTAGGNTVEITFASPAPYMQQRNSERPLYEWIGSHEPKGRAWVRKEPCSFGWDWGPVLPSFGIWKSIGLHAIEQSRLADFSVLQDHSQPGLVRLDVDIESEFKGDSAKFQAAVSIRQNGKKIVSKTVDVSNGSTRASLEIKNPKLWWPAGMGAQPLYDVEVRLLDAHGESIEQMRRRVGLRTLKLLPPTEHASLRFEVNGIPFFSKGANFIPADSFPNRVTPEILRRYITDAVAVNMNTLRFWGGGYYEEDALFDLCDEMGICVWLDFKFACSAYPAFDAAFVENVRLEARDNLRRLRHHACIAVWCGNNEISLMTKENWSDESMGRADYDKLFKEVIAREVKELAPQAEYVSGSPDCGDMHFWKVWHGNEPFEIYRTVEGFMSEFGFQSFPDPKTVAAYTIGEDRTSILSPVMKWHQRSKDDGNEKIRAMIVRYFKAPRDFESEIWLSQLSQGYGIKMGAEHWRRTMPKSMGCVFWQYNDCWPTASWSSVDYFGRWKALHYLARRFYAPILVSGLEDAAKGTIEMHISSDSLKAVRGKLSWEVTTLEGETVLHGSTETQIAPQQSSLVKTLDLQGEVEKAGAGKLLTWIKLEVDGRIVSENLASLVVPKSWALVDPGLNVSVKSHDKGFAVTIKSQRPALWTWLTLDKFDAKFSDNFIHLPANGAATIYVYPREKIGRRELMGTLRVRSLYDLSGPA